MPIKKAFYTDPLEALWMSENFNMKFINSIGEEVNPLAEVEDEILRNDCTSVCYIHPDSLNIIKPQIGDLMRGSNNKAAMYYMGETPPLDTAHIVQRDGVPFMWPEFE